MEKIFGSARSAARHAAHGILQKGQHMDIKRIKEMESRLDECTAATADLDAQLGRMEALRDDMISLFDYYGSSEWYEDREGEVPKDVAAGVLSEDLVYDQIMAARDAAFRMLDLASDILKNRI